MKIEVHNTVDRHGGDRGEKGSAEIPLSSLPSDFHDSPGYHEEKNAGYSHTDYSEFKEKLQIVIMCVSPIHTERFGLICFENMLKCSESAAEDGKIPECRECSLPGDESRLTGCLGVYELLYERRRDTEKKKIYGQDKDEQEHGKECYL